LSDAWPLWILYHRSDKYILTQAKSVLKIPPPFSWQWAADLKVGFSTRFLESIGFAPCAFLHSAVIKPMPLISVPHCSRVLSGSGLKKAARGLKVPCASLGSVWLRRAKSKGVSYFDCRMSDKQVGSTVEYL